MDVVFREDLGRLRTGHGLENMVLVKHIALNLPNNNGHNRPSHNPTTMHRMGR